MAQEQQSGFKDPTVLTLWTKWLLYFQLAITVIAIISGSAEYQLLQDFKEGTYTSQELATADAAANDARQGFIGILQFIIYVISGVLILKWIHRANYNARELGASGMMFTPGWSVGWYFIPVLSLWKPYQAMKEIWQASHSPQNWNAQTVAPILQWWWAFWIISNLSSNASFRLTLKAKELEEALVANVITQLSDAATIPLIIIFLPIVTRLYKAQMSNAQSRLILSDASAPMPGQ